MNIINCEWRDIEQICSDCGWKGKGNDAIGGTRCGSAEDLSCPNCGHYFGLVEIHLSKEARAANRKYIEGRRKAIADAVQYFGAGENKKFEREKWVALRFAKDVGAPPLDKPPEKPDDIAIDCSYRDANFQIKTIFEPGRRPHGEYKDALKKASNAKSPQDLLEEISIDNLATAEIVDMVASALPEYAAHYSDSAKRQLDLLVYVNKWGFTRDGAEVQKADFSLHGYRSVSVLTNDGSFVLGAEDDAPDFIRDAVGRNVVRAKRDIIPSNTHIRIRFGSTDDYVEYRKVTNRAGVVVAQAINEIAPSWSCDWAAEFDDAKEIELLICWGLDTGGFNESLVPAFEQRVKELCREHGLRIIQRDVLP